MLHNEQVYVEVWRRGRWFGGSMDLGSVPRWWHWPHFTATSTHVEGHLGSYPRARLHWIEPRIGMSAASPVL